MYIASLRLNLPKDKMVYGVILNQVPNVVPRAMAAKEGLCMAHKFYASLWLLQLYPCPHQFFCPKYIALIPKCPRYLSLVFWAFTWPPAVRVENSGSPFLGVSRILLSKVCDQVSLNATEGARLKYLNVYEIAMRRNFSRYILSALSLKHSLSLSPTCRQPNKRHLLSCLCPPGISWDSRHLMPIIASIMLFARILRYMGRFQVN